MAWNFSYDRPIYLQISGEILRRILSGELEPGSRIPSVRDIAGDAAVNPNTVQRAMGELERLGLIRFNRTVGREVTDDRSVIEAAKVKAAGELAGEYLDGMKRLGYGTADAKQILEGFGSETSDERTDGQ